MGRTTKTANPYANENILACGIPTGKKKKLMAQKQRTMARTAFLSTELSTVDSRGNLNCVDG